jgi:hypothetical protein
MLNFTVLGHHCNPSWNLSFTISSLIKLETHVFSECGSVAHSTFKVCCCFSQTEEMLQICFKSEDEEELILSSSSSSSSSYTWAFALISGYASLSLPCTFFFCPAQNRRYLEDDDEEEKQRAREEEEKREKMQQRCCCYQCKQDPYYSLWMRCSSVSRFFRGTRQTRLNLHHLHSLLKQTLGRRRANKRVLIGERERERERYSMYVCTY